MPCYPPDRRDFLKTATAGALALAESGAAIAATDRISIGFIGVGTMGTDNLKAAMAQPGVAVGAICDVYQPQIERASALARRSCQRRCKNPHSAV